MDGKYTHRACTSISPNSFTLLRQILAANNVSSSPSPRALIIIYARDVPSSGRASTAVLRAYPAVPSMPAPRVLFARPSATPYTLIRDPEAMIFCDAAREGRMYMYSGFPSCKRSVRAFRGERDRERRPGTCMGLSAYVSGRDRSSD